MQAAPTIPKADAGPSKRWRGTHPIVLALAAIGALVAGLVAFEAVHWALEGFPPPREHAAELLEHLHGLVAAWLWRAPHAWLW